MLDAKAEKHYSLSLRIIQSESPTAQPPLSPSRRRSIVRHKSRFAENKITHAHKAIVIMAAVITMFAERARISTLCIDKHRCRQSNNDGKEGEAHF